MPSDDDEGFLSTGVIVAVVVGSVIGFAICIVFFVILVALIKHRSRPRQPPSALGMVPQQPYQYPYPHSWATQYPPNITSVSNDPPPYNSVPPPYTAPAKSPYT